MFHRRDNDSDNRSKHFIDAGFIAKPSSMLYDSIATVATIGEDGARNDSVKRRLFFSKTSLRFWTIERRITSSSSAVSSPLSSLSTLKVTKQQKLLHNSENSNYGDQLRFIKEERHVHRRRIYENSLRNSEHNLHKMHLNCTSDESDKKQLSFRQMSEPNVNMIKDRMSHESYVKFFEKTNRYLKNANDSEIFQSTSNDGERGNEEGSLTEGGKGLNDDSKSKWKKWMNHQPISVLRLDKTERLVLKIGDERDAIQKKTFTKWVNKHLGKTGRHVEDLFVDLTDGFNLIALLEALSDEHLPRENGYTRFHRIQNVQYCLDFLKKQNIKTVNIRPEDIVEGNSKLTLGLIWTIILNFQVSVIKQRQQDGSNQISEALSSTDGLSARDALLQWAQDVTRGYPGVNVRNFTGSWRDGLAFNAIMHRYRPNLIQWSKICDEKVSARDRLNNAFTAAETEFGVSRLLDAEDVDVEQPDEKSIITYVSSLYNALPHSSELHKYEDEMYEYEREASEWLRWVQRLTRHIEERPVPSSIGELRRLEREIERLKVEELPPKLREKQCLAEQYTELNHLFERTEHLRIAPELSAQNMDRAWQRLLRSLTEHFTVVEERASVQGSTTDIISRLTRGIGITNEKLDHILIRIDDTETRIETSRPSELQRVVDVILDDLVVLESPISSFFSDVDQLKELKHPQTNDFNRQVYGLEQRRNAYITRLKTQFLTRIEARSETLIREAEQRHHSARRANFGRVEECIQWTRTRLEKLIEMEFVEDLEHLEAMFEQHKVDNHEIQDFRQNVDECIARQAEVSADDTHDYCDLLSTLESEYQQLRDLSAGRMLDLDTLIAFIRGAQHEIVWINEREDIEVARNWSDITQLDLPMLQNYYKQLLHEIELRESRFNEVHNQGAALLNQGHPAIHVIEFYLNSMQRKWEWLLSLSKCLERHLRDALNLRSFTEDVSAAEDWMIKQKSVLEQRFERSDFSLDEGEQLLRELDEMGELIRSYSSMLAGLNDRVAQISPLWQRGEQIQRPIPVTALADYVNRKIKIKEGDECVLVDNSNLIHWMVRGVDATEATLPSVIFRIPPPDARLLGYLNRLHGILEKQRRLWEKKHSYVRYNMVLNTMAQIRKWDLETFVALSPDERDAVIKALNEDGQKLLSEVEPGDNLAKRLKDELKLTNEHFYELLRQMNRPREPEVGAKFDEKVADLLKKLNEAHKKLTDRVTEKVPKSSEELERLTREHKDFEDGLQTMDVDVSIVKELYRQVPNPTPTQRSNIDYLTARWEDLWELSRMYVECMKTLEMVLNGLNEVSDLVRHHEVALSSFDSLPVALDRLRGVHAQLLEFNMVLQQQQSIVDSLNRNVALLRQHTSRTRQFSNHPDVDRFEDEVQMLTVRWENVCSQVVDRLKSVEQSLQSQMAYRSEYDNEIAWLERVEGTLNSLRNPEELRPEQYQHQFDLLAVEYTQLQERTEAVENVNREGGKFIREAKSYDNRLVQYMENVVKIHGGSIRDQFRRSVPQPKSGAEQVAEELENLNKRFARLSSLILERRNTIQVFIQNWKRKKQEDDDRRKLEEEEKRRQFEAARRKALEDADRLRRERKAVEDARRAAEDCDRLRRAREAAEEEARRSVEEDARRRAEEVDRLRREREAAEKARRGFEDEARRRAEEDLRRKKAQDEENDRIAFENDERRKRKQAQEDAERERKRKENEEQRRRDAEAARERKRREELERLRRDEEERKRHGEDLRKREDDERRKREEEERRRREENIRKRPKMPDVRHGLQQTIVPEGIEVDEFEEITDVPERATIAEHEDEMQMYQEETVTKTQFYELEGILHKQTGEILTFVEAIRQGLLDLHSGGGEFYDLVSGAKISLEKAAELGYIDGGFNDVLNTHYGIRHPESHASLSLLEAIQAGLYDPDVRQIRDIETGVILPMYDCITRGILTLDTQHRLIKMGVLKLPPMSLENAIDQGVVDRETGQFTGKYTRETMPLKDALYSGYIQIGGNRSNKMIAVTLSDCLETDLIDGIAGEFVDKRSGEKITLREAVSKQTSLLNLHVPEIVKTDENRRITLSEAIIRNAINTRQGNFTDLRVGQSISLKEAYLQDFIQKPMTLTEVEAKGLIDSTSKMIDTGTKNRYTLLEAIAAGFLEPDIRHIVDPGEEDVISIAEALERGLLEPNGRIVLRKQQKIYSITEGVNEGLLIKRARHTIFDVKGIKNTSNNESVTFNEAVELGIIILQAERIVDLATRSSYLLNDSAGKDLIDPLLFDLLTTTININDIFGEGITVFRAVAKGIIDSVRGVFVHRQANQEMNPKEAYDSNLISLLSAIQLSALLDVHPSLVSPVKKIDKKRRIKRPGQKNDLATDQVKVSLAEAMKQGLIDSRTHRFRQGEVEMSFEDALHKGLINPSDEWIIPSKTAGIGPTIEEKVTESVAETAQQLAPKFYPDKNIEETVTTVKKIRKTETTAIGGPGGVSVYRSITGGKNTVELPASGFHVREAERKNFLNLKDGTVSLPGVDRILTLEEALDLGVIDSNSASLQDPETGERIMIAEAISKRIIDTNGCMQKGGELINLQTALERNLIKIEPEFPERLDDATKKVLHFTPGSNAIVSFRPVGSAVIDEAEQSWSFDASTGEIVDADGQKFTLDVALEKELIDVEDLRVWDTLTGRDMSFEEAGKWGIINQKDRYYLDKRENKRYSLTDAARQHRIFPTGGVPENASDATHTTFKIQKRTEVSKKEAISSGPSAFIDRTLINAIDLGMYNASSGLFTHPQSKKQMTLKEAILKDLFSPYGTVVTDTKQNCEFSILDAIDMNIIDDINGKLLDTAEGKYIDFITAHRKGLLKCKDKPRSLEEALLSGELDLSTGKYATHDGRKVKVEDAIASKLIDAHSVVVRDLTTGDELAYEKAVQEKIVDPVQGLIHTKNKSETLTYAQALMAGVIVGTGSKSHISQKQESPKLIEQKLQLTPYAQPIQTVSAVAVREQIKSGQGRQEVVDLGGGKQVTVKVIRGEGGVEKGEYVDPASGMKFTIQLHGDPYVTEAKTVVKSTAQVQSVELEPHAEFVGIDKIRDKRNGRVMSLQDAQRIGIARVDKKGKQMIKTYSVFRSNIQNAITKGIIDISGNKISLDDAIRAKLIDLSNLTYISPKTGDALPFPQAANMGLIDVTLSEILPKGVCHPASGERISIQRAVELGIINSKTGEVTNPFANEKLSWLDIVKPIYNSLTMEGVYDPTKGYCVPILTALTEGLIDTTTAQYCNLITGEKSSLEEASSKGLIDTETLRAMAEPFLVNHQTRRKMNLIEAVREKFIDPKSKTIVIDKNVIMPVARAATEGKIPLFIGERLKRVDKLTFAEALGKGLIDVIQNRFTDPDSGRYMTINQAMEEGYIDTENVKAINGSDERNLANILHLEEFDANSGRIKDKKSGLYLTFKSAVDRDVIDGDSLLHDLCFSQTMTIREALSKNRIDADGKYIDAKSGSKINLKEAVARGLIALIASPMHAAQAVTEAVKRRDAEGYRFKIEPLDEHKVSDSSPRFREESTVIKLSSPHQAEPGFSYRVRSASEASAGKAFGLIDDPLALVDLQQKFLDHLKSQGFDTDEKVVESPASSARVSIRDATESGLFDVATGEIVHNITNRRYSIPKAVSMKLLDPNVAKCLLNSLNSVMEFESSLLEQFPTPGVAENGIRRWSKTVSWRGQPSDLRQTTDHSAPQTTFISSSTTMKTSESFR